MSKSQLELTSFCVRLEDKNDRCAGFVQSNIMQKRGASVQQENRLVFKRMLN